MTTLYGIKNCDTMKKAMKWLTAHEIDFTLHDYKKQGLDAETLDFWLTSVSWEILLNRRGTTWRKLDDEIKSHITEASAKKIMLENLSVIKRPVLVTDESIYVGFKESTYQEIFINV